MGRGRGRGGWRRSGNGRHSTPWKGQNDNYQDRQTHRSDTSSTTTLDDLMTTIDKLRTEVAELKRERGTTNRKSSVSSHTSNRSENPDFSQLSKALFQHGMLERATQAWQQTPESIVGMVKRVINAITPPMPDAELHSALQKAGDNFANTINEIVKKHLDIKFSEVKLNLQRLDNRDLEEAQKVASSYLKRRLPNETTEQDLRHLLENAGRSMCFSFRPSNLSKRKHISPAKTCLGEHSDTSGSQDEGSTPVRTVAEIGSIELMDTRITLDTPAAKKSKSVAPTAPTSVHLFDGTKDRWVIAPLDERKLVVLGDSNLRHAKHTPGVDFFVLPGAHIRHAAQSIRNWVPARPTDKYTVAIQIGINNRGLVPDVIDIELKELKRAVDAQPTIVKLAFVGVSIPPGLTDREKANLHHLNTRTMGMVGEENYVDVVDDEDLEVDNDNVHYRQHTVDTITTHIASKLAKKYSF